MKGILVICEHQDGEIKKYSKELVYKASEIAQSLVCDVAALVYGDAAKSEAATLGIFGAQKVFVVSGAEFGDYNADRFRAAAVHVIGELKPSCVLASATPMGKELMPLLALRFDSGMASECIDIVKDGDGIVFRRPLYAGKAWADVRIVGDVKFATVRPNVFAIGEPKNCAPDVRSVSPPPAASKVTLKERRQAESKQVDLVEANVIVSGGRAMGNSENYAVLRQLAMLLNASIGASRAAVDAGYISHDHQVGQTGKTVNPTLYIACGISGAIQHLAGMKTSKIIVAINKDPEAPIFTKADFGIVGDLFKVVPAVVEKLKAELGK